MRDADQFRVFVRDDEAVRDHDGRVVGVDVDVRADLPLGALGRSVLGVLVLVVLELLRGPAAAQHVRRYEGLDEARVLGLGHEELTGHAVAQMAALAVAHVGHARPRVVLAVVCCGLKEMLDGGVGGSWGKREGHSGRPMVSWTGESGEVADPRPYRPLRLTRPALCLLSIASSDQ